MYKVKEKQAKNRGNTFLQRLSLRNKLDEKGECVKQKQNNNKKNKKENLIDTDSSLVITREEW